MYDLCMRKEKLTSTMIKGLLGDIELDYQVTFVDAGTAQDELRRVKKYKWIMVDPWNCQYIPYTSEILNSDLSNSPNENKIINFLATFVSRTIENSNFQFSTQKTVSRKIKEISLYSDDLMAFEETISESTLSEKCKDFISNHLQLYKNWFNKFVANISLYLYEEQKFKGVGIGKGKEGYIPFLTWSRPPTFSQLVKIIFHIDKLSQLNIYRMETCYA